MVSNRTHEYLQRRTILDYHFRGEQDKFEERHPELKEKALKMMGPVLYYELSSTCGQPLCGSSKLYEQLWALSEKLEQSTDKEFTSMAL